MKKLSLLLCCFLCITIALAQQEEIHFVGHNLNTNQYIKLSKIEITNLTRNWTETFLYPDTTLILKVSVGIEDQKEHSFGLKQNNPNPFVGTTDVTLEVAKAGKVTMTLTDILGRTVKSMTTNVANPGLYAFRVHVAATGTYLLTARQNGKTSSIKMINQGMGHNDEIAYVGTTANLSYTCKNGTKGTIDKTFYYGDVMQFKGYAEIYGEEIEGAPVRRDIVNSEKIQLPVNPNVEDFVCGVSAVVDVDGNIYNTLHYDRQCWLKENMRTTRFPNGEVIPFSDNEQHLTNPYRYIPNNDEELVPTYGYLYNWAAAMNGKTQSTEVPSGVQGICPTGWHLPSLQEFLDLYDYVSSIADYVCEETTETAHIHIAKAMASPIGWMDSAKDPCSAGLNPEQNNATGFSIIPAGNFAGNIARDLGYSSMIWTATENQESQQEDARIQYLDFGLPFLQNLSVLKVAGVSVRCLRDY